MATDCYHFRFHPNSECFGCCHILDCEPTFGCWQGSGRFAVCDRHTRCWIHWKSTDCAIGLATTVPSTRSRCASYDSLVECRDTDLVVVHFHPKIPDLYCDNTPRSVRHRSWRSSCPYLGRTPRIILIRSHSHSPPRFRAMCFDCACISAHRLAANWVDTVAQAEEALANETGPPGDGKSVATLLPDSFVSSCWTYSAACSMDDRVAVATHRKYSTVHERVRCIRWTMGSPNILHTNHRTERRAAKSPAIFQTN